MEIYRSVRKPTPPPTKVERPNKGGKYERPSKNWRTWCLEDHDLDGGGNDD